MAIADESVKSNLAASLAAGIASISQNQSIVFTQYTIARISQDGTVFWIAGQQQTFFGSLHYGSNIEQREDETLTVNDVVFTAPQEVSALNAVNPSTVWVAPVQTPDGVTINVAFKDRGRFYEQAQVWHYRGQAVFPVFQPQIVASAADLPTGPIVSNSLPIWLLQNADYPVYPSFAVSANVVPPYIAAHVASTRALAGFPALGAPPVPAYQAGNPQMYAWPASQLLADKVRLTLYGLTSAQAVQFFTGLMETSRSTDVFGFMDSPAFYDDRRTQPELQAVAMKKTLELEASYYLSTADAFARRYILSAAVSTSN